MAHFYGKMRGRAGEATQCGTKDSGMETVCASWAGAVQCTAYIDDKGIDCVLVEKIPWRGIGENRVLYDGPIGKIEEVECDHPIHRNPALDLTIPCPECAAREAN